MTRPVALVLAVLVAGCPARRDAALDAALPDGPAVEARAPADALESFASSSDPRLRAAALSAFVAVGTWPAVERWVTQGTYDPDPWVQERVAGALFARGDDRALDALVELALRGSADPYVRARVAHDLIDRGREASLAALRAGGDEGEADWRAAPLSLVASRLGSTEARALVERAVRRAEFRDDPTFVVDLGRFGWPDLVGCLEQAATEVEEESAFRLTFTRALLGDASGRAAWAASLRRPDPYLQRDALDLVRAVPAAAARPWLEQLRGVPDGAVRLAAAVALHPTVGTVTHALAARDPLARMAGATAAASLGPADAAPLLRRALLDPEPDVRIAAADAAGTLRLPGLDDVLQPLAVDDRSVVRAAGQAARLRIAGPGGAR